MTLHYYIRNNHVPGFTFLEFLVDALPSTSLLKAILGLQKIPSTCFHVITDCLLITVESKHSNYCYFFNLNSLYATLNSHLQERTVTRKRNTKRLKHTGNPFKKNLHTKGVC